MLHRVNRPTNSSHVVRKFYPTVLVSLLIIFTIGTLICVTNTWNRSTQYRFPMLKWNSFGTLTQFMPFVEYMNGTDIIWQIPKSPKAVLFIFHGCNGKAANFWDRSPSCPNCIGLPEERLIVLHALYRKFAVVTISSIGRCWSFNKEKENVIWMIKWWTEKYNLEKLPIVAMGASSGGYFVSALAYELNFSSIVIMIAEGVFEQRGIPEKYPPTLFIHMPKDSRRALLIEANMQALMRSNVQVKEITCVEFPLTPYFLSDRIPGLDQNFSEQLYNIFREKTFIDDKGFMMKDGRKTPWKQILKEKGLWSERYEWDNHIQEELNLAYAYHEMTSLQSDDMFNWFASNMS